MAGTASVRAPKRLDTSVVGPRGSALLGLGRVGGGAPSVLLSPWHKAVARDVQRGQWPCIAHTWARRARAFYACALRASITFIFLYPEQAEDAMARQSYWLTSMALPRFPKLRKDVTVDVVIIGGHYRHYRRLLTQKGGALGGPAGTRPLCPRGHWSYYPYSDIYL